jgi:hypothetical protein
MNAYSLVSRADTGRADNQRMEGSRQESQSGRRASMIRLLAAALAGAIGAFGVPAGAHVASQTAATAAPSPTVAASPEPAPQ